MRLSIAIGAFTIMLATTASAHAGGWATVGVAPLPSGIEVGETWQPEITVLQHGVTPLGGLSPTLTIREERTGESREFTASATDETGVYQAHVIFPEAGSWNVVVESGFWGQGGRMTFGPAAVGQGQSPGQGMSPGSWPFAPLTAVALALAALAAITLLVRRRWRPAPAAR
jgi:hypothetical protein